MSHIFISYKREDQATARKLANALESKGWTVWWDSTDEHFDYVGERLFDVDVHLDDVITKALKEASLVIVVWSVHALHSRNVLAQIRQGKRVTHVTIDNSEPPPSPVLT